MNQIEGYCEQKYDLLKKSFVGLFEKGSEIGASCSVAIEGKTVVHLWGGMAIKEGNKAKKWEENTLANTFSVGKAVTNITVMKMVEKGLLRLENKFSCLIIVGTLNWKKKIKI